METKTIHCLCKPVLSPPDLAVDIGLDQALELAHTIIYMYYIVSYANAIISLMVRRSDLLTCLLIFTL